MQAEWLEQTSQMDDPNESEVFPTALQKATWVTNASLFWDYRRLFFRVAAIVFVLSIALALALPKEFVSTARIMPPEQGSSSSALLAAIHQELAKVRADLLDYREQPRKAPFFPN